MTQERPKNEVLKDMKEVSRIARSFMRGWDCGVLSTLGDYEGGIFPMGSITPYVLTEEGEVIILISNLANHTKNIWKDNKVCFTVFDMEASYKQAAPRVSLVSEAEQINEEEQPDRFKRVSEKYFTFFPQARNYFNAHAFYFFTLKPKYVHFIRTFGQIYNYETADNWMQPTPEWKGEEQSAIDHMNEDHSDALKKYSKEFGENAEDVKLVSVDAEGFHMKIDGKFFYKNFNQNANDMAGLRNEFVILAKA